MKTIQSLKLLVLAVLLCNCSDDSGSNDGNPSDDYLYFVSGKIDGNSFLHGQLTNSTELDYSLIHSGSSTVTCAYYPETGGVNYYSGVYPNFDDTSLPSIGMEFVRFFLCTELNDYDQYEVFNDRFPLGDYDVAINNDDVNGTTGAIAFSYSSNAEDGPYYTTNGDQTGSYVEITKSTPDNAYILDQLVESSQVVEGNFSIKLYNENNPSDIIIITDGQFKLRPRL